MSVSWAATLLLVALLVGDYHVGVSRGQPEMDEASTKLILRARGYKVEEHFFTSRDGYRLRLTRGTNPHFAGAALPEKLPILFVHGILEAENVFVINSRGARAKNLLAELDVSSTTELSTKQLKVRLAREPSARSLPLLALNCGHEVWLLSRRGFPGSQELVGDPTSIPAGEEEASQLDELFGSVSSWLSSLLELFNPREIKFSLDKRFWNFSLDEQAEHDFPQAVDYVLAASRPAQYSQLSVVSHSAGGALQLMALSTQPQLASKIASSVLWSPAYSLGHGDMWNVLAFLDPVLTRYTGPIPPTFTVSGLQTLAGSICSNPITQLGLCQFVVDFFQGPSGGQQPISAENLDTILFASSSHELAQNVQMIARHGRIHRFNWGSRARNQLAYGRDHPPAYNSSLINSSTMSFYAAATDRLVTPADVRAAASGLRDG